ncbi:MAG TPA: DegT/DnrJ/EryC1/StrS family aminotransferase [Mycobacteriales bacterium]|nr:DegT/DnrJ/EryC1/StrS family aminotransferase [Mycobacteriales bacterium]
MIPVSLVRLDDAEEQLVLEVLRSGQLTQGRVVADLEAAFAQLTGTRHVVAVNSGTTALVAALRVLGIGPGDEVITSPFTFAASVNAILSVGATARLVDIGSDFNIDAELVRAAVTERTRALLPVHLYGQMADMPAVEEVARSAGVAIVEDAAQAHGASIEGRPAGSFGLGCFSLYATKNLFAGEGGLISTDDDELADRLRVLRNQGMRDRYDFVMPGENYRMTDVHAAIALPQLQRFHERTQKRQSNAKRLAAGLTGIEGLTVPEPLRGRRHVWHQFTIRVTKDAPVSREEVAQRLAAANVGSAVYYPRAIVDYDCYARHPRVMPGEFPEARRAAQEVLSLPVHPWLTSADLDHVIESVREAVRG